MGRDYFIWYNLKNETKSVIFDGYCKSVDSINAPQDRFSVKKSKKGKRNGVGFKGIFSYLSIEYEADSFSDLLVNYMRDKNLTSRDIYERSYIDRKLLNKILNNAEYHPSKRTTFNLCIALQLSYEEGCELLSKANYTFSKNNRYDLIYAYALESGVYDIDEINEVLNYFGFPCIGD